VPIPRSLGEAKLGSNSCPSCFSSLAGPQGSWIIYLQGCWEVRVGSSVAGEVIKGSYLP